MKKKITAETILGELILEPKAAKMLTRYQLPCLSCPLAGQEMDRLTLGQVAERYGLPLEKMLKELQGL